MPVSKIFSVFISVSEVIPQEAMSFVMLLSEQRAFLSAAISLYLKTTCESIYSAVLSCARAQTGRAVKIITAQIKSEKIFLAFIMTLPSGNSNKG